MNQLTMKDVSFRYEKNGKKVLNHVNASFASGVLYAIIGKSGAGKSTLLSLLSGMDHPLEGSVEYCGVDLRTMDPDAYRANKVGVIFQNYNLLYHASVVDNVSLAMEISKQKEPHKKQAALALLEKVGIHEDQAKRKVLQLSGGEQQRVAIARALATHAEILIADEPTGNLDPETEAEILAIFQRLAHEEGKCVIIVTHSQAIAKQVDQLYTLQNGSLR